MGRAKAFHSKSVFGVEILGELGKGLWPKQDLDPKFPFFKIRLNNPTKYPTSSFHNPTNFPNSSFHNPTKFPISFYHNITLITLLPKHTL